MHIELQELIKNKKIEIGAVLLAGLALFGGKVLVDQYFNSQEQSLGVVTPTIEYMQNNSAIVHKEYKTYLDSCNNFNLVEDPFGPRIDGRSSIIIIKGDPACKDNLLSAEDFPLTQ